MVKWFFIMLLLVSNAQLAFGQGAAIFMPLSKTVMGKVSQIPFRISNRLDSKLTLNVEPQCEVDGRAITGGGCWNYFKLVANGQVVRNRISIAKGQAADAVVHLKTAVAVYGFFKARFRPEIQRQNDSKGVSFVFDYQPGYLFLVNPKNTPLPAPKFDLVATNQARVAKFSFDTKRLLHPELVSVSAQIVDKSSKKLVRFMRLANQKIIDPTRGEFNLTGQFASPEDQTSVCYKLYLQVHAMNNKIDKYTNCE